jgi:hypothetical protein
MFRKLILIQMMLFIINNMFAVNDKIFSTGSSSLETLAQFLSNGNKELGNELVNEFAKIYMEEDEHEGINWDVAFVQMCLETGFLKYGGLVDFGQNNFCGLGSFSSNQGASFPTIREGVRAHVQHLKAYSSTEELKGSLLDPRFHLVQRGSAPSVLDLAGRWAEDPKYGHKLLSLLDRVDRMERGDFILKANIPLDFPKEEAGSELIASALATEEIIEYKPPSEIVVSSILPEGDGWLR